MTTVSQKTTFFFRFPLPFEASPKGTPRRPSRASLGSERPVTGRTAKSERPVTDRTPRLALVDSAPGPGRLHAWLVFSSFGVKIPGEIRSAPALSAHRLPFDADSTSEIRPKACLFACCLLSLRHRLPDRNPASSLLACLLLAYP